MTLSRPSSRTLKPLGIGIGSGLAGAWLLVALGCGGHVGDETRLTALSSDERDDLCDEIRDRVPSADEAFTCDAGYTVRFGELGASMCGGPLAETCTARVGDVRACIDALVADPCSAAAAWPSACTAFEAAGCSASSIVGLNEQCPALAPSDVTPLEGLYELVSHTRNDASCEAEGTSVLGEDTQGLFVLVNAQVLGTPVAALQSCTDRDDCQRLVAAIREASSNPAIAAVEPGTRGPERSDLFTCTAESPASLLGGGYTVGSLREGECALSTTELVLARAADGSVRAEGRTFAWTTPAQQDECSYGGGRPPANAPCATLEVYAGRFISAL
ncbi:MAG TPA: hypothetical protein VMG12_44460 [Polyangiaceae bacterium]|nr:hypothetical protein [Polyangiaceae bacterium]